MAPIKPQYKWPADNLLRPPSNRHAHPAHTRHNKQEIIETMWKLMVKIVNLKMEHHLHFIFYPKPLTLLAAEMKFSCHQLTSVYLEQNFN